MNTPRSPLAILLAFLLATCTLTAQEQPHREYHLCGDEATPPPAAKGTVATDLLDRYGRPWRTTPKLVAWQERRRLESAGDCGGFRLDFQDVIDHTGVGFDDPTPLNHSVLGSTTLGALRQRTVCEVFSYIASVVEVKGTPDLIIRSSQMDGGGFLAAAGPFFLSSVGGFVGGTLYDHITSGVDPTPAPGSYDASIIYDFGYSYNDDWAQDPGARIDLFSVTLHEATHALGFLSLISPNGTSNVNGSWSIFDKFMRTSGGAPVIDPISRQFAATQNDLLSNALIYNGLRCRSTQPVYSPNPWKGGSSLSHFDMGRSGVRYVMRPSTGGGPDRAYTPEETEVLCEMGYTLKNGRCNACAPQGVDDYAMTTQGVEVCTDVVANDIAMSPGLLAIDPASVQILAGGGSTRIQGTQLCYTPDPAFVGLARILYAPSSNGVAGSPATLYVNVLPRTPGPRPSRRDYDLWYFGENAGLAFGSGTAVPVTDGALATAEGCATICRRTDGSLLFYTDGVNVWDATHTIMPEGSSLAGSSSTTQSALIVPDPGDTSRYYIFTAPEMSGPDRVFAYSIVDMRMNGGRGDVVMKNVPLFYQSSEKLAGARHANGRDYWVIGHEIGSDHYMVYRVTCKGVDTAVVSSAGQLYALQGDAAYRGRGGVGYLKVSTDGKQLAAANTFTQVNPGEDYLYSTVELLRFDNATGVVSDAVTVDTQPYRDATYYGIAFSPDNTKLYAASYWHSFVMQWNITDRRPSRIENSRRILQFEQNVRTGALQLGPDRKIYVEAIDQGYLGIINDPDSGAPMCNFVSQGVHLAGRLGHNGLPNMIDQEMFRPTVDTSELRITKRVDNPRPHYGDTIAYTIGVCNLSACVTAHDVVVEDHLPAGLVPLTAYDSLAQHTIDSIPSGECSAITLRAIVGPTLPVGTDIVNCATIVSALPVLGDVPLDSNCATIVLRGLDLGVAKSADHDSVAAGGRVNWNVMLTCYGPDTATNVVLNEKLPTGLTYVSDTHTGPAGSYDPVAGMINVPVMLPGEVFNLTITCAVDSRLVGPITNCVELATIDQSDLDLTNNRACATVTALNTDLGVLKSVDPPNPRFGAPITWMIIVSNAGPRDAVNVLVRDRLPAGMRYINHTLSDPRASYDTATGDLRTPLLRARDTLRLVIHCVVDSNGSGAIVNCVDVVGNESPDHNGGNNNACATAEPRWCTQPDRTATLELADQSLPVGEPEVVPVLLTTPLDTEGVRRVRITIAVDSGQAVIANGGDPASLLQGTRFEGWRVISHRWTKFSLVIELDAGPLAPLTGTGDILHPSVRLYLGGTIGAAMRAQIDFPDDRCIASAGDDGYLRLDSLCGLGLRLIEMGRSKYAVEQVRPNPVTGHATLAFSLGLDGPTRIDLHDAIGALRGSLLDRHLDAGTYEVDLDGTTLPSGLYYLTILSGNWSRTVTVIVNR